MAPDRTLGVELTEDDRAILKVLREFCEREVGPTAKKRDETSEFPRALMGRLGSLGFLGPLTPKAYGGLELPMRTYVLIMEELARWDAALAVTFGVHTSVAIHPLVDAGTEQQKAEILPALARGERIGAFAISEPGAGSDPGSLVTSARRDGDSYVLNGTKTWCTNGHEAGHFIVMTRTDAASGNRGLTAFAMERPFPEGFRLGHVEHKMGIRSSVTSEVHFDDCRIPAAFRIGSEGQGFKLAMKALDASRIAIGAQALGIARGAFEESLRYANEREQFGRPIGSFQGIQFKLADMATRIDASRLLVHRAAALKDAGKPFTREASEAKLFATESAQWITNQAVQIHGGVGYTTDANVERYMRDARVTTIYEGTSEIQLMVIARQLGLPS
ncbi:MAG: acyl-CoA dehydrogenase family protein [Thermoplasmatota archaeon]